MVDGLSQLIELIYIFLLKGLAIYFFYGLCHSTQEIKPRGSTFKEGTNNQGFEYDSYGAVVIPSINIVPPTPMSSRPNTLTSESEKRASIVEFTVNSAESSENNTEESSDIKDKTDESNSPKDDSITKEITTENVSIIPEKTEIFSHTEKTEIVLHEISNSSETNETLTEEESIFDATDNDQQKILIEMVVMVPLSMDI